MITLLTTPTEIADGTTEIGDYVFYCPGGKPILSGRVESIQGDWIALRGNDGRLDEVPARLVYRRPWSQQR